MRRKICRTLLMSAILSASLALGVTPSHAQMAPADAGISDADWSKVVEIGELNGAYLEYVDDQGQATLVFTGGAVPSTLQYPQGFTGFEDPTLTLYGEYSQFATNDQINTTKYDTVTQIQNAGYTASADYNADTDVVDVVTMAPSSVTSSLVATYGSKIHIVVGNPEVVGDPENGAFSDADWAWVVQISELNGALTEYVNAQGEATLVFTGGTVPDQLQWPQGFTGFSDPNLVIYGVQSQFASNSQVDSIVNDAITRIQNAGYSSSANYNPNTDVVDVVTNAPSSVTSPLVATYGSKIHIIAGTVAPSSDTTDTADGSPTKHAIKKHTIQKHTAKKHIIKKYAVKKQATKK